jgi:hypothetical protein
MSSAMSKRFLGSSEQAEKTKMNTVTIGVASISDTRRRASAAFRGNKQCARISRLKIFFGKR